MNGKGLHLGNHRNRHLKARLSIILFPLVILGASVSFFLHAPSIFPNNEAIEITNPSRSDNPLEGSMAKLRKQLTSEEEEKFDRSRPIYLDFGLSDAADTKNYLSKGYSVVSVDAFLPWISKAKEKFRDYISSNRLLLFNVGLSTEEKEAMPLYYKSEGSVIASFMMKKGCQGVYTEKDKCFHTDVEVVRCESVLQLVNKQADIMKVDIEMLHHTCLRGLHRLEPRLLPKHVCWEEHDKPFGPAEVNRPLTDAKLILGLYELAYSEIKIVLQGPLAKDFYDIPAEAAGFGQGSGNLLPDEMMHYRSYESNADGKFDTNWRRVHEVFTEGIFAAGKEKPKRFFEGRTYYDICMKLSPRGEKKRDLLQDPESFPLSSYSTRSTK